MQKRFIDKLSLHHEKQLLLAVSGGLDSVVLLDLLAKSGSKIAIAHVNFQLRGSESDLDEAWVRQLAANYNRPVFVRSFETNNYAIENGISIQMAARDLRYHWFEELRVQNQFDFIVTAHHLNDNLETTLHNFIRSTGLTGMIGMQELSKRIFRPLLDFTRAELETYAKENNLLWREDSSNASDDYHRNFIRHQIIPALKEINPSLEEAYRRTIERLSAANELSEIGLNILRERYVLKHLDKLSISKKILHNFQHPAGILWELSKEFGFNLAQCDDIVKASAGQSGKYFLSDEYQLVIDRDELIIAPVAVTISAVSILENESIATMANQKLTLIKSKDKVIPQGSNIAMLDADKLIYPLTWRTWREGDFFYPLGMTGRKKISDFLIDKKIPVNEKNLITVLESSGDIVWVVGQRIDERYKVTDKTEVVLRCWCVDVLVKG